MIDILSILLVSAFILVPLAILAMRKNILGEFILGMLFGAVWEGITKGVFSDPMLFTSLNLLVIIAWGIIFVSTTYYAEEIKREWGFTSYLIPDIMSAVWGLAFEIIGYKVFSAWEYDMDSGTIPLLGLPYYVLVGWPVLVIVYNNFIRIVDPIIEGWAERRHNIRMKIGE